MSERTLGKARGLNSIADPADFKGSRGRRRDRKSAESPPPPPPPAAPTTEDAARPAPADRTAPPESDAFAHVAAEPQNALNSGADQSTPVLQSVPTNPPTPHRAVVPGLQRKRRELSVPVPVADALAATGINPADVVMSAYRRHSDAIYAGHGGRMVSRGRQRLRVSISDGEFDKLTRLGEARGWNRSETVAVLLTLELLTPTDSETPE